MNSPAQPTTTNARTTEPRRADTGHTARTHGEACIDLDYLIRLTARHRRLYRRMAGLARWLEIFGGSGALAAAVSGRPAWLALTGSVLAATAAFNIAVDPAQRAHQYADCLQRLCSLRARSHVLTLVELDSAISQCDKPDYWEALRMPSYNDNVRSHGFDSYARPLTLWQRLAAAIA